MGGGKPKKSASVVHPNSRKAGQHIKRLAHDQRVSAQKKLRELKDSALTASVVWFQDQVEHLARPPCYHKLDELIDRFLLRREDDIARLEAKQDEVANRKLGRSTLKADELRRLVEQETTAYITSGLEIPDISTVKGLIAVQGWGNEVIDLVKIPVKKFTKRQLVKSAVGPACQDCMAVNTMQMDQSAASSS